MRDKSKKRDPVKETKELMKQYERSNDSNKRRITEELKAYSEMIKKLNEAVGSIGKKNNAEAIDKARAIADDCHNARARIMWHLNVIDTNYRNYAALVEPDSLKKAMKLRCVAGKYRANVLVDYSKREAEEEKAVQRIPSKEPVKTKKGE